MDPLTLARRARPLVGAAICALLWGCPDPPAPAPDLQDPADRRGSSLAPPPRDPGPPRRETPQQLRAAAREAAQLARSLAAGGVAPREVASIADMRGYRLYRDRSLGRARAWFEQAAAVDPAFEMGLFNAARCAALQGDAPAARRHLARLHELGTPLARSRLRMARAQADFAPAWADGWTLRRP